MQVIVDTGPFVAFFDRSGRYHLWAAERVEEPDAPLLVCEPVLTETIYLLARFPKAQDALFELLQNGALAVAFRLEEHIGAQHRLLRKYRDMPMSLAGSCVVRMAEVHNENCCNVTGNARYDIQKEIFAGPVDDFAGDETRDQAEHNPSGD